MTHTKNAYLCIMFVRKKKNRSGSVSIVVVDKAHGRFREVKNFGVAFSVDDVESLCEQAKNWIKTYGGQQQLDFNDKKGRELEEAAR